MPKPFLLPEDIDEGDWIEFGGVGAYGAACRTAFNGFYADTFVTAAAASGTMQDAMKAELVKKGVAYQANWMYVLHEFEDAIADCTTGDVTANDFTADSDRRLNRVNNECSHDILHR